MHVTEFQRLSELQVRLGESAMLNAYNFDPEGNATALKFFRDLELDLKGLDAQAWGILKTEATPLLIRRDPIRGWRELFDKLNEAKGYNYLTRIGCSNVRFIPRSAKGRKTPDLEGWFGSEIVLCEVKTINPSDDECRFRKASLDVKGIAIRLPIEFFKKLESVVNDAEAQMDQYCSAAKKIAYVVLNYDDLTHQFMAYYSTQLDEFIAAHSKKGFEVVFDAKPPFYYETS